jgi:hypothetical protein
MLSGDANKPVGKSGERKRNTRQGGKKAEARRQKAAQQQAPQPEQFQEAPEVVVAEAVIPEAVSVEVASTASSQVDASLADSPLVDSPLVDSQLADSPIVDSPLVVSPLVDSPLIDSPPADNSLADSPPVVPVTSAETGPVSYQTIANAYRDYTLQSLDRTGSFFEKLAGARSLDKAVELQTEFARQAYEGFATESQKICELHGQLARQRWNRWEDFAARMINPSLKPRRQA